MSTPSVLLPVLVWGEAIFGGETWKQSPFGLFISKRNLKLLTSSEKDQSLDSWVPCRLWGRQWARSGKRRWSRDVVSDASDVQQVLLRNHSLSLSLSAAQATSVTALNRFWHGLHGHHRQFPRRPCRWPSVGRHLSAAEAAKPQLATPLFLRWTKACRLAIVSVRLYSVLTAVEKHANASPNR